MPASLKSALKIFEVEGFLCTWRETLVESKCLWMSTLNFCEFIFSRWARAYPVPPITHLFLWLAQDSSVHCWTDHPLWITCLLQKRPLVKNLLIFSMILFWVGTMAMQGVSNFVGHRGYGSLASATPTGVNNAVDAVRGLPYIMPSTVQGPGVR